MSPSSTVLSKVPCETFESRGPGPPESLQTTQISASLSPASSDFRGSVTALLGSRWVP